VIEDFPSNKPTRKTEPENMSEFILTDNIFQGRGLANMVEDV